MKKPTPKLPSALEKIGLERVNTLLEQKLIARNITAKGFFKPDVGNLWAPLGLD